MPTLQRPIGFSPQEISALVNEVVVEQHAENAAFLWTQRDQAVHAHNYSLSDLADLDERVEANLDGLRVAGDVGWKVCETGLEVQEPGEVFAAAVLALGSRNDERIQKVLDVAVTDPQLERAVISALGWLPFDHLKDEIHSLINAEMPECRRVAVGALAVHRQNPGDQLDAFLLDSNPRVRSRALRLVGEIARRDLMPLLKKAFADQDEACQFWATWAAARLGERTPPIFQSLRKHVENHSAYAKPALEMALRCMAFQEAKQWRNTLREHPLTLRLAIQGAGILGDPELMPELLIHMETKETSRVAGESFSMITGVDLAYLDLDQDEPDVPEKQESEMKGNQGDLNIEGDNEEEGEVEKDDDEDLSWPNPALVADWWRNHQKDFIGKKRYLCGKQITFSALQEVLKSCNQRQRGAAALEQSIWKTDEPLFEIRAVGKTQMKTLSR
ncbi:MAG: TIGR02270 family protein [Nitrospirales bacterium]